MTIEYGVHQGRPGVIAWLTAYCVLMALVYAVVAVGGVVLLVMPATSQVQGEDQVAMLIQGVIMLALGVPLAGAFGAAPFLPRRPWVWIYDLVLICLGLTSVCCMPATIPLLIFWIKPEAKAWFGRG